MLRPKEHFLETESFREDTVKLESELEEKA